MAIRFYSSTAAETTLSGTINNSATTIVVGSTTGFPVSFPYTLALDYEGASEELVDVTAAAGTSLTVTRAADGTSASSHNAGARVRHVSSARDFRDSREHENDVDGVHGLGASSAVVGTTDTQSLSNKTLVDATGTLNRIDILSEGGTAWQTTVNGDIDHNTNLMVWKRGPAEPIAVAVVANNGNFHIRNQDAGADTATNTYRLRITKNNGTTDIFSVLSGGTATSWTDSGQSGFIVKPRTANNDVAFRVRNTADSLDTFAAWNNGRVDINGQDPAFSQLDVTGAAGQSAAYMRVLDSVGNGIMTVNNTAKVAVNGTMDVRNDLHTAGVSEPVLRVFGRQPGQTGDLQQWVDPTNTIRATMDENGNFDSNMLTPSGSITAASGFSIATTNVKIKNGVVYALVVFERTGATITANAEGEITDTDAFTLPAAMRPNTTYGGQSLTFACGDGFQHGMGRLVSSTGVFELVSWASNGDIQSGRNIRVYMSYPAV
ncbi:hypothetical protein SEA_STELLA_46 [Streptomyces phage Stella]|nr:hypothetical protein SEA_STELLA_46 [Streptomyces phage Stella]